MEMASIQRLGSAEEDRRSCSPVGQDLSCRHSDQNIGRGNGSSGQVLTYACRREILARVEMEFIQRLGSAEEDDRSCNPVGQDLSCRHSDPKYWTRKWFVRTGPDLPDYKNDGPLLRYQGVG